MPAANKFRVAVKARFDRDAERIGQYLLYESGVAAGLEDVRVTEELIDTATGVAIRRTELAVDSAAWQGYQVGRLDTMENNGVWVAWELEPGAEHCDDCLRLAAFSPYPPDALPGVPGEAPTACDGSCKCNLVPVPAPNL